MITKVNDNISIWQEFNPLIPSEYKKLSENMGLNKQRISIKNRWFDIINPSKLIRSRNKSDGYYRVIYIQINMDSGEYYIGKANLKTWSQLKRYQGSGLKFKSKYKKYKKDFVRYYIAFCQSQEETEELEASIVDKELLMDDKCLNLVTGGGGTTNHPTSEEKAKRLSEYMKNNPNNYKTMLDSSKKAFQSGDTPELLARTERIKETMSTDKYREMTRERIKNWKENNPEEYAEARKKNRERAKSPESRAKRQASRKKWIEENPEAHIDLEKKRIKACKSEEARKNQSIAIKKFINANPEKAKDNAKKRGKAAGDKLSKEICMIDLETGNILQTFPSQQAAARWLVDKGIAKNTNCVSSIGAVCLRRACTTGYGYRKKAYGYDWRFREELKDIQC